MDIEEALTTYLLAQTGLTALIDRRFSFGDAPQNQALPYVVCITISDVKDHTLRAQSELEGPVYQLTVYAATRRAARAVARQIKAALQDFTGEMSGVKVQYIQLLNELTSTEEIADTRRAHICDLEFEINYLKE